jgi:hypothetical protein
MPFLVSTVSKVVAATVIAATPVSTQTTVVETFCYEQPITFFGLPTGATSVECRERPIRNMTAAGRTFTYHETITTPVTHSFTTR